MLKEFIIEGLIAFSGAILICTIFPLDGVALGGIAGLSGYVFPELYKKLRKYLCPECKKDRRGRNWAGN